MRKTKIICTIGPATSSPEMIEALIEAGMDGARLNFSHGDHASHAATYEMVRRVAEKKGRPIAVIQDLQGPKIRTGRMRDGAIELKSGQITTLTTRDVEGTPEAFQIDYEGLPSDVSAGEPILLDDGLLSLEVVDKDEGEIRCRVLNGGVLRQRKGVNLPSTRLSLSAPTEKDLEDLAFGLGLGVDFVALSFVQGPADVKRLRAAMPAGDLTPIVSKIERPLAVEHLEEIIAASDGIMMARGDLGVELPAERVPAIQKTAVERTNAHGKLVIIATQMLDSMTRHPRPTRAEVSDVANAVLDGTDAMMLSGETAVGDFPVETTRMMSSIITEAERSPHYHRGVVRAFLKEMPTFQNAAARAAVNAAEDLGVSTIAAFTNSGATAALISEYRPGARLFAFSSLPRTLLRMALYWGVEPRPISPIDSTDEMFEVVGHRLLEIGACSPGDSVVIVAGVPPGEHRATNIVKLARL